MMETIAHPIKRLWRYYCPTCGKHLSIKRIGRNEYRKVAYGWVFLSDFQVFGENTFYEWVIEYSCCCGYKFIKETNKRFGVGSSVVIYGNKLPIGVKEGIFPIGDVINVDGGRIK